MLLLGTSGFIIAQREIYIAMHFRQLPGEQGKFAFVPGTISVCQNVASAVLESPAKTTALDLCCQQMQRSHLVCLMLGGTLDVGSAEETKSTEK